VTKWNLPFGVPLFAWTVRLNALSVCFQLALWLLAAAVSVYSFGYLRKMEGRRNTGILGFFYYVMPLSLPLVFAAANVLLFPSWRGDLRSTHANFFAISQKDWSGRGDLNARPPAPKRASWLPRAPSFFAKS